MKVTELKKHHQELNLPVGIQLEIMEAHAARMEDERDHLKELVERLTAYSPPRAKDVAMALGYLNALANDKAQATETAV